MRSKRQPCLPLGPVLPGLMMAVVFSGGAAGQSSLWLMPGQSVGNNRNQPAEHIINASNVGTLTPLWVFPTAGGVSATPTVADNAVYFPDWAGNIYAVDKHTGQQIWSQKVSAYNGGTAAVARASLTVSGGELIFGDRQGGLHDGAHLLAVNRYTGALLWTTQIDSHPAAWVTGPAVVFGNVVYQGVSSNEEGMANTSGYACCTFRGSMVALDARTGRILWKTYTVPDNHGASDHYSGGAIWQPPVIDSRRGLLYVGTGNNYSVPASVRTCQAANPNSFRCVARKDYFDSALALDLRTGAIRWSQRLWGYDVWTLACTSSETSAACPPPTGPDYDLGGSGANLVNGYVGFGQKSGIYWALNPANGSVLWGTSIGPGGEHGGMEWGTATDGKRIYVASANSQHSTHALASGQTIAGGSWSALDAATGKILWQTADPTPTALDLGAVSVANGIIYAGSTSGYMYGLDARSGKILWSFNSGLTVFGGPSIADGVVYWGSGYSNTGSTGNNKVYAFAVP